MKNKLQQKAIATLILLSALCAAAILSTLLVNISAAVGSTSQNLPVEILQGDPSVLQDLTLHVWLGQSSSEPEHVPTFIHSVVRFDETGAATRTDTAQTYMERSWVGTYEWDEKRIWLALNRDFSLQAAVRGIRNWTVYYDNAFAFTGAYQFGAAAIISETEAELCEYHYLWITGQDRYVVADGSIYFTVTDVDLQQFMRCREEGSCLDSYVFTSGILRVTDAGMENLLPITISSEEGDTEILALQYIPQTNCFALITREAQEELLLYIYHADTGAVETHRIANVLDEERLICVNDNYLTIVSPLGNGTAERAISSIETQQAEGSRICYVNANVGSLYVGDSFQWYRNGASAFYCKDGLFYICLWRPASVVRMEGKQAMYEGNCSLQQLNIRVLQGDTLLCEVEMVPGFAGGYGYLYPMDVSFTDRNPCALQRGSGIMQWFSVP